MGCGVCVGHLPGQGPDHGAPGERGCRSRMSSTTCVAKVAAKDDVEDTTTVKGSQFKQPLLEFSGSCAGCAETAYARLVTQVCSATVCISPTPPAAPPSGAVPLPPLPTPSTRRATVPPGPTPCSRTTPSTAWACTWARRPSASRLADKTRELIAVEWARPELKAAAQEWLDTMDDGTANAEAAKAYVTALEESIATVDELASMPAVCGARRRAEGQGRAVLRLRRLQAGR